MKPISIQNHIQSATVDAVGWSPVSASQEQLNVISNVCGRDTLFEIMTSMEEILYEE